MKLPPSSPWKIPLFAPDFGPEELEAVQQPVRDGWLTMGPRVARLEEEWRRHTGARHAIAVSNGTTALHLAALASGLGPGDEALCPALTFVATANAIRYVGANPIFVECKGAGDLNMDPDDCARRITPRTKALFVLHYAGFPADMEPLLRLALDRRLAVVEDSAHALFSRTSVGGRERVCGTLGQSGIFSLFSNKNITCGEGGVVTTDNDETARQMRLARSHGMTTLTLDRHEGRAVSYDVLGLGYNFRLDEIRASLALAQLERLPRLLEARFRLFRAYRERLRGLPVTLPFSDRPELDGDAAATPVGIHILSVILAEGTDRGHVMARLKEMGIQSSIHYPPVHQFQAFKECDPRASLPRTEALAARQLTLPFYPAMTFEQVDSVATALSDALKA